MSSFVVLHFEQMAIERTFQGCCYCHNEEAHIARLEVNGGYVASVDNSLKYTPPIQQLEKKSSIVTELYETLELKIDATAGSIKSLGTIFHSLLIH